MTVPSHFHMPGAFHGEGVHPGLFRPPMPSPSASSCSSSIRPQVRPTASYAKRKRHEISRSQEDLAADNLHIGGDGSGNNYFGTPMTVHHQTDKRYYLAGQLDTPCGGAPLDAGSLGESMYSDSDYRRALGSKRAPQDLMDLMDLNANGLTTTTLFTLPPQPTPYQGWSSFAFSAIGGVVGRVWDFCRGSGFRGFQAGGGKAFEVTDEGVKQFSPIHQSQEIGDHVVPGRFPEADHMMEDSEDHDAASRESTPTRPAAKRRHTEQKDDLGKNWVMVDNSEKKPPQALSQPRCRPRQVSRSRYGPSVATGRRVTQPAARLTSTPAARPVSRRSSIRPPLSPPLDPPRLASSASFASPRCASPSMIPLPTSGAHHRRRSSLAPSPSPAVSHRRSQSSASVASNRGSCINSDVMASPRLNAEAQQLAARRKMEDRDTDVRISAFNKRLQDMIRQGKEALGTTIEVDGGWEDEDL